MADYDIAEAFRRIELLLIESMSRNLGRHQKWETDEGINWTMWQAEQVKDMRRFAQQNQKIFGPQFKQINEQVKKVLAQTAGMEGFDQENEILKALISGADMSRQPGAGLSSSFFGINDRKLGALINSTTKDLEKAENAMLRKVNDEYRKTIFNAHTYFESGASNLKQAIDMATDDFLKKGINCIEYKNGRIVNIASYSEMALRTANTRAGLIADGAKRRETGHHLVKISEYGACSETCMPWQGKVYVDDIYSGGTEKEARETGYELLSTAVAGGLFHPNCRHRATTYYPELEDLFDDDMSDPRQIEYEHPPEERKQRQLQLDLQKEKRLAAGSLDPEKRAEHEGGAEKLREKLEKAKAETAVVSSVVLSQSSTEIVERNMRADNYTIGPSDELSSNLADFTGISKKKLKMIDKAQGISDFNEVFKKSLNHGRHQLFLSEFAELPIIQQREVAKGMLYMEKIFGVDLSKVQISAKTMNDLGEFIGYPDGTGLININQNIDIYNAFCASIHELAHLADHLSRDRYSGMIRSIFEDHEYSQAKIHAVLTELLPYNDDEMLELPFKTISAETVAYSIWKYVINDVDYSVESFVKELVRRILNAE